MLLGVAAVQVSESGAPPSSWRRLLSSAMLTVTQSVPAGLVPLKLVAVPRDVDHALRVGE